eukprot:GHVT01100774.1.p1 GENE.GHVT01100774.1~~GHVT01100774.1.p1  ORF type:complete len:109 (+),score=0.40 GHVT01100774.1:98-424(+)
MFWFSRFSLFYCFLRCSFILPTGYFVFSSLIVSSIIQVSQLSEHLWPVEGRAAAIANNYYVASINRVGTEFYPHEFTSGNKRSAHKSFGYSKKQIYERKQWMYFFLRS